MQVEKNTVVSLRYIMKNAAGEIMEDNINAEAIEYIHGSGNLLPSVEAEVTGLGIKDKKTFLLSDEKLEGEFVFDVTIDNIRMATKEEIENGLPVKKPANECGPGCCC